MSNSSDELSHKLGQLETEIARHAMNAILAKVLMLVFVGAGVITIISNYWIMNTLNGVSIIGALLIVAGWLLAKASRQSKAQEKASIKKRIALYNENRQLDYDE